MELATLAAMVQQQFDRLNQRVDNLQESLNTRVDNLQYHGTTVRSIIGVIDPALKPESLTKHIDATIIRRVRELDISLSQRNDVFQDSLTRRIDDTMLRRSNDLQGFLAQRLDDTMAQRTEVLQKNLVQEMFNFHNSVIIPLFDGIHGKLAAHDRDIQREFQNVNKRFNRVDTRIDTLDMDMKREFNNVNERFTHMQDWLDKVETKVEQLEVKIDRVEAKIEFRLKDLIEYYRLQDEVIQATAEDDDSFADTELEYTEQELEHAISSNAWGVLVVLGGRIGIDCDTLHDRVIQFHAQKNASSKRDASDLSGTNKWAAKIHHPLPVRVQPASESQREADVREPSAFSGLCWEFDSEKFKQSLDPALGVARLSLRLSKTVLEWFLQSPRRTVRARPRRWFR
ncbi:hypothetical protein CA14_006945 [Aspergillus flavus]|uniref:Uncharacterized protein n=1 Tax=Aspergillus flavus TaxID=5059 RepID=A0AB74CHV2_ASPFL|nr:hypothetical protein CA14_006945 [Aspergillus flavus]